MLQALLLHASLLLIAHTLHFSPRHLAVAPMEWLSGNRPGLGPSPLRADLCRATHFREPELCFRRVRSAYP